MYTISLMKEEEMKLKIVSLVMLLSLYTMTSIAEELKLPKCDNRSTCVDDKNYYVEVKRVVRRGDIVIVQLEYTGKTAINFSVYFKSGNFKGHALILDAQGHEFKISGKEISNFGVKLGQKKIVSFRFSGNESTKIIEPFDLTVKTEDGEFTLFDLKQESRFRQTILNTIEQK